MPYYQNTSPVFPLDVQENTPVTRIIGFIRDSANLPITNGWLEITADDLIVDGSSSSKTLVIPKPRKIPLTGSQLNIELINSQYSETTYRFRVGETDVNGVDTIYSDFHAQVPYGLTVDITSLVPQQITREQLPSTIYRIAELITTEPQLKSRITNLFNFRGNWVSGTQYEPYDLVFVPGAPNRTLICTTSHISGATINNSFWQQLI